MAETLKKFLGVSYATSGGKKGKKSGKRGKKSGSKRRGSKGRKSGGNPLNYYDASAPLPNGRFNAKSNLAVHPNASGQVKGGGISTPASFYSTLQDYKTKSAALKSKVKAYNGGGSDWVMSQYSAGPVNSPVMSEKQFRAFNKTSSYPGVGSQTVTSAQLDAANVGKNVTGLEVGDSLTHPRSAEVYASVGGKKRRSHKKSKSPKKSHKKRSHKKSKSPKRSHKKRSHKKSKSPKKSHKKRSHKKSKSPKKSHKKRSHKKSKSPKKSHKKRSHRKKGGYSTTGALTTLGLLGLHSAMGRRKSPRRKSHKRKRGGSCGLE